MKKEINIGGLPFTVTAWDNQYPTNIAEGKGTGLVQITFNSNQMVPQQALRNFIDEHNEELLTAAIAATQEHKEFYDQFEILPNFPTIQFHLEDEHIGDLGVFRAVLHLNLKKKAAI